ncbi:MAG: dolichyl-phosphate beta-glucosyltransferase [Acidobacteriota bacterium]
MPRLSIVVPAYNEAARLPVTLPKLADFFRRFDAAELLVVDDGSRDQTAAMVEEFARLHPFCRLLKNPGNRGKGYSVRHGMLEAKGDWILSTDADLSSPIDEVMTLWAAADRVKAPIAIGSRALDRSLVGVHQSPLREWSGRAFNLVMRLATGLPYMDTQCGFKMYRRDAAQIVFPRQRLDGFGFDVEDLLIAQIHGLRAVEVPVHWNNVEGTKVSSLSGAKAFTDLALVRWNQLMGRYK